ncbi:MAG TPA: ATP-binding cassette domain-containing protein [Bacilli bacterium]|nr:ATP-binding cassette domain-containing protein [Bacilli bacterium]
MLKVEHIKKYYGNFLAVDDLSFSIKEGEIFGLLGVNGAGKTTTFRVILGLLDKNNGTVLLDGKPIDYSVTDKIGFLTEERSLLLKLTVKEQALFYGALKGMEEEVILKRLDNLLTRFNISSYKDRKIKELSKGNQQKVQFIMAILNEPKLLILDEPFSGLDPINAEMFKEVIREYRDRGCMIIFSSHQLEHVEQFCEKIVVLVNGKSVLSGYLKDIKNDYRKKNIRILGDVSQKELENIPGVLKVTKDNLEYLVSIKDINIVSKVFKYVSKCLNILKFEVEEPSLNEIFINVVGESYEK